MKRREFIAGGVAALSFSGAHPAVAPTSGRTTDPLKLTNRAEATAIIANARKIVTPNGVERLEIDLQGTLGLLISQDTLSDRPTAWILERKNSDRRLVMSNDNC
jgi:hypothetical protein